MAEHEKLIERFSSKPKDFTWAELTALLQGFGYEEVTGGKTGGSRRRFIHDTAPAIFLHKPHPGNELKMYQVKEVFNVLVEGGFING